MMWVVLDNPYSREDLYLVNSSRASPGVYNNFQLVHSLAFVFLICYIQRTRNEERIEAEGTPTRVN